MSARFNLIERLACLTRVLSSGYELSRRNAINQVMRRTCPFGNGGFSSPDIEFAVHRDRIAVHDLAVKAFGERQR